MPFSVKMFSNSFAKTEREGDLPMTEHELRGLGRRQLLELMLEQGKEMESSKAAYEKDLDFLKAEHERDLEYLKAEHEKETSQLKKELEQAKAAMKEQANSVNEAELEAQKSQYEQTVESLKAQHQQDLEALKEEHKEETAHLREELEQAKKSLEKREIALNEAGSIAVAALQINGVFEAAQAASQQYIENIRSLSDRQAAICAQRDMENRVEVERKLKEAEEKCAAMEYASKRKCEAMEQEANSTEKHRPERESWKSSLSTRRKARSRQSADCHVGRMVEDSQSIDNFLDPPRIRVRNQPSRLGWLVPFSPSVSLPPRATPPADRGNHLEEWPFALCYNTLNKTNKPKESEFCEFWAGNRPRVFQLREFPGQGPPQRVLVFCPVLRHRDAVPVAAGLDSRGSAADGHLLAGDGRSQPGGELAAPS